MSEVPFEIFGGERIGDKAGALREHLPLLKEVGMDVPPTWVVASEATEEVRAGLAAGGSNLLNEAARGFMNDFAKSGESPAVVVRSSGEGDARGSGIYESVVVERNLLRIAKATRQVLRSFNEPHAVTFREGAGHSGEFAVMYQPLVGQRLDNDPTLVYGPPLSGFAYSSSRHEPDGLISVVPGIGGGVDRKGGEVIRPEDTDGRSLYRIIQQRLFSDSVHPKSDFRPGGWNLGDYVSGLVFTKYDIGGPDSNLIKMIIPRGYQFPDEFPDERDYEAATKPIEPYPLEGALESFYPTKMFEQLVELERRAGYPIYIEWAMTFADEEVVPYVVQIAPYEQRAGKVHEVDFDEQYIAAHTVTGSGIKKSDRIVHCWNPGDIPHLRAYNADPNNVGYILVFSSRLTTSWMRGDRIEFRDCNNATVLIEQQDARHAEGGPVEHLRGAVDITDKLIGVEDWRRTYRTDLFMNPADSTHVEIEQWKSEKSFGPDDYGYLTIKRGDFTVRADEETDTMTVGYVRKTD